MVRYSDIIKSGVKKKEEDRTNSKLNALPLQKDAEYMKELYSAIVDYLKEIQKLVKNNQSFDIKQAVDTVNHIINTPDLIEKFYQSIALSHTSNNQDYLIHHLAKVMIYSIKIGTGMKYSREELLELGLAALFYDIGFFKVPENIITKKGSLTEAELDIMKNHTKIGKNILSRFQTEHPMMPRIAYEHHERKNGSGYPAGLKGKEICEYAKIIALSDTFDAMTQNRPYRKALAQYFSIKELVESRNSLFSARIIKVFLDEMGIFPIGSYVKLNNTEIGKVVATSKSHPLKPTVELMFDSHGNKMPGKTITNLDGHPVLYVTGSVSEEDFPGENKD